MLSIDPGWDDAARLGDGTGAVGYDRRLARGCFLGLEGPVRDAMSLGAGPSPRISGMADRSRMVRRDDGVSGMPRDGRVESGSSRG